jgi:hypothetical protein
MRFALVLPRPEGPLGYADDPFGRFPDRANYRLRGETLLFGKQPTADAGGLAPTWVEFSALGTMMTSNNAKNATSCTLPTPAQRESLTHKVQELLDVTQSTPTIDERRSRDRFPIPYTFRLIPIDNYGNLLVDDITTIVGKDLSLTGIGFSHDHELRYNRAIISLDHPKVGRFAVEAEIVWTRQTPIGLYETGCRLVRTVDGHIVRPNG